jgi:microcystin degradation protein MlrC
VDEAIDRALAGSGGPFVLADPADNAGGGSPSDNMTIARAIVARRLGNAAVGPVWDPLAVRFAFAAGEGAVMPMRIGGKTPVSGAPLDAEVEIRKLAPDAVQSFAGGRVPLGDCAGVRIPTDGGGVDLVLTSRRTQGRAPDLFENVSIPASSMKILVVKSTNHFHAAFAPIAKEILYVDSDGPLPRDYRRNPYRNVGRPLWPLVEDPFPAT